MRPFNFTQHKHNYSGYYIYTLKSQQRDLQPLQNLRSSLFCHHTIIIRARKQTCKHGVPSILYALLGEYCLLIFSGKTMPWYLSMAMQVIVRMPVTMAVVCTKGTVLHTRTPAGKIER